MEFLSRFSTCTKVGLFVSLTPTLLIPVGGIIEYADLYGLWRLDQVLMTQAKAALYLILWAPFQWWAFTVYGRISLRLRKKVRHKKALDSGTETGLIAMSVATLAYWWATFYEIGQETLVYLVFAPVAVPMLQFGVALPCLFAFYIYARIPRNQVKS